MHAADRPCRPLLTLMAEEWSTLAIGALEAGSARVGQLQRRGPAAVLCTWVEDDVDRLPGG